MRYYQGQYIGNYSEGIWQTFRRLKKQCVRCKTQKQIDRYSKIEVFQKKYITFKRFCDECEEYFSRQYCYEPTRETIQEVFDNLFF